MIQAPIVLESFGATDTGCVRKNNEDCFRMVPALGLWVVADGMGGAQAGEHASRLATDAVVDYVTRHGGPADPAVLEEAFHHANRVVMAAAAQDFRLEGMGTTLIAVWQAAHEILIASVGDSRVYSLGANGLRALTEDQSWVNEVGRQQLRISDEQLRKHPMRHVLTMAIGVAPGLRVNTYRHPLSPGETTLLCTDGLYGVVTEEEIARAVEANKSLGPCCQKLVALARDGGGPDNITVVLLRAPR